MSEEIRLQKFMSEAGVASRRAAEEMIRQGLVTVNGQPALIGQKIDPAHDRITVAGKRIRAPGHASGHLTLLMHKPPGWLCSHEDPHHTKVIFDLLPGEYRDRRFVCAGRLDLNSEGLLILTTDGELANRIMHPSSHIVKKYRVTLHKPFPKEKIPSLLRGVMVEGEQLKAERVFPTGPARTEHATVLEVHLHHGRKREIRRLFETLGYFVKKLRRFQIGDLTLRGIPPGCVRRLNNKDLQSLGLPSTDSSPPRNSPPFRGKQAK